MVTICCPTIVQPHGEKYLQFLQLSFIHIYLQASPTKFNGTSPKGHVRETATLGISGKKFTSQCFKTPCCYLPGWRWQLPAAASLHVFGTPAPSAVSASPVSPSSWCSQGPVEMKVVDNQMAWGMGEKGCQWGRTAHPHWTQAAGGDGRLWHSQPPLNCSPKSFLGWRSFRAGNVGSGAGCHVFLPRPCLAVPAAGRESKKESHPCDKTLYSANVLCRTAH